MKVESGRTIRYGENGAMRLLQIYAAALFLAESCLGVTAACADEVIKGAGPAVSPQYSSTHVYVAPADFDRFVASVLATFGGTKSRQNEVTVTPTPSRTLSQLVLTPVGTFSVFGFKTPIPYPFGGERTGYLVTDLDAAVTSAAQHGADIVVAPFDDPIGRDAIIAWPGGVHMQLYWHTVAPNYAKLETIPDNRVYISAERADLFVRGFVDFSAGKVVADDPQASGIEIGRRNELFRRVRITSAFGNISVQVTDGHLPYPYGREITGYGVSDLAVTLNKAKGAGATVLVDPYDAERRRAAIIEFPGGYIAEIHAPSGN
jgi:predicted enzyme related to lactoylglutathione lyase